MHASLAVAAAGMAATLGGLAWDAARHSADPGLAGREGVLTLASASHALFVGGVAVAALGFVGCLDAGLRLAERDPGRRRRAVTAVASVAVSAAALGGTWVASASERSHHHDGGTDHVQEAAHDGGTDHVQEAAHDGGTDHSDGHTGGHSTVASDGPPTAEQVARSAALIEATRQSLERWVDVSAAEADGFHAIQGPEADYIHFIHRGWMSDGAVLDAERPESLVYRNGADGLVLESAMYILPSVGYPIPDVGGSLTTWHNHGDLCFRTSDLMIVGTTRLGGCPEGSVNVETPDMLHVWIVDHSGGPFAGLEGMDEL